MSNNMSTKSMTRKKMSGSTIAIITLSALLIVSIAIGATLAYFSTNKTVAGQITLGNPVNLDIQQGGATVTSLTFSGDAMPGTVYDQSITVSIPANTSNALLRAKLVITNTDSAQVNVEATTKDTWAKNDDDYYYYKGVAKANDSIDFVTAITIPTSLTNDDAKKTYSISIVVEAIQEANSAARTVWTTASAEWLDQYAPTTAE